MIKKKKDTINSLAIHDKDVGSTEIQIGLLTDKISKLAEHFKNSKKPWRFQTKNSIPVELKSDPKKESVKECP